MVNNEDRAIATTIQQSEIIAPASPLIMHCRHGHSMRECVLKFDQFGTSANVDTMTSLFGNGQQQQRRVRYTTSFDVVHTQQLSLCVCVCLCLLLREDTPLFLYFSKHFNSQFVT